MTERLGIEFEVDTGNSGAEVEVGLVVEVDIDSLRAVFELEVGMVVEVDSLGAEVDIDFGIESLVGQDIVEVGKNTVLVDDLEEGPLLDIEMTLMEI